MTRNRLLLVAATMLTALSAGLAPGATVVASAQGPGEDVIKVDVVLTRSIAGGQDDPRLQAALQNLARQEALFEKGLISKGSIDQTRIGVKTLQAQQAATTRLPYSLLVAVGGSQTRLRVDVSVPQGQATRVMEGGVKSTERQYHPTGTSIDCQAARLADGRYRLNLSVSDTSIVSSDRVEAAGGNSQLGFAFRTYSVSNQIALRDGQTLPFSVGTDRITGETLRAEVTVSLLK